MTTRPEFIPEKDWKLLLNGRTIHIGKFSVQLGRRRFSSNNWLCFRYRISPIWYYIELPYPRPQGLHLALQHIKYAPKELLKKVHPLGQCIKFRGNGSRWDF